MVAAAIHHPIRPHRSPGPASAQNWRADVVALFGTDADTDADVKEWVKYSSDAVPHSIPKGDYDLDGDPHINVDAADTDALDLMISGAGGWNLDFNRDGNLDQDDLDAHAAYRAAYSGGTGGRGVQSRSAVDNTLGYAGYTWDGIIGANHVRHRAYLPSLGRWTRRDPLGYVDGMSVYEYVGSHPHQSVDALGLMMRPVTAACIPDDNLCMPPPPPPSKHDIACQHALDAALADQRVVAALAAAAATCPGIALPLIELQSCSDEGHFSCSVFGGTTIAICKDDYICPSPSHNVSILLHEILHFTQFCRTPPVPGAPSPGGTPTNGYNGSCLSFKFRTVRERTLDEIEAYCSEPVFSRLCPPKNQNEADIICRAVTRSGGSYCDCMSVFGYRLPQCVVTPPPTPWHPVRRPAYGVY